MVGRCAGQQLGHKANELHAIHTKCAGMAAARLPLLRQLLSAAANHATAQDTGTTHRAPAVAAAIPAVAAAGPRPAVAGIRRAQARGCQALPHVCKPLPRRRRLICLQVGRCCKAMADTPGVSNS